MTDLAKISDDYRSKADRLLLETNLVKMLEKYGKVTFVGSYAAVLMMNGDIDIHVLREKPFSKDESLHVFNEIVKLNKFNSHYFGDWNGGNLHPEFPEGYYLGVKKMFEGEKWKIDIWLVSKKEQEDMDSKNFDITKEKLSDEQREAILEFKKYRNDNGLKISGQKIYEAVLKNNCKNLEEFVARIS